MTCGVRTARNTFSKLRRQALQGEEIIIMPESGTDFKTQAVSIVPTWLLDELCSKTTNWRIHILSQPGAPVSHWAADHIQVSEIANQTVSEVFVFEHQPTGITGLGRTKADAIDSLINGLIEYANEYYSDLPFYLSPRSGRREHLPYLRMVKRYENDRKVLANLFIEENG